MRTHAYIYILYTLMLTNNGFESSIPYYAMFAFLAMDRKNLNNFNPLK